MDYAFLREELSREPLPFHKIVLSDPAEKDGTPPSKITVTRILQGEKSTFLAEKLVGKKALHQNLAPEELADYALEHALFARYRQINLFSSSEEVAFRISKKGKVAKCINRKASAKAVSEGHNRKKQYLIAEGDPVEFLVHLGIFTSEYKVVASKYDKFRQINRFVEILDHAFRDYGKDTVSVLDFGCGKSYLTFFVYYYFSVVRKKKVHIIGYDLKEDVVAHCNDLAKRFGYHGLQFVVADVTRDRLLSEEKIDFVLSLHACDIATDYALNFALEREVPYIFSVPCCQHEVNATIRKGEGDLDLLLDHGLFRERTSALITDAFRTKILESEGYRVEVMEFVDLAHSPKNIMLRAKRKEHPVKKSLDELFRLEERYGFRQTLLHLRKESL